MLVKKLVVIAPLVTTLLILTLLVTPVNAQAGGHLWFYSQDPDTLSWPNPNQLPNPEDVDPKYVDAHPDEWLSESIIVSPDEWETPFSIWLACAQFESLNTKVVVSINEAAFTAIESITINENQISSWMTGIPSALAPHGVFNSAEFHGYTEVDVGNLYSPTDSPYKVEIEIQIDLKEGADLSDAKIHFDAYGSTERGGVIFSPYSHDATLFVVPEGYTVLLVSAPLFAFALYAYKHRRN